MSFDSSDYTHFINSFQQLSKEYDRIRDTLLLEIEVLVTDPIRNIKKQLQEKCLENIQNYDIWLKISKILNEENSLFELIDIQFRYVEMKCEICFSLNRITILDFVDITTKKTTFNWQQFCNRKNTECHVLPENVNLWSFENVRCWMKMCIKEFHLTNTKLRHWNLTGAELLKIEFNRLNKLTANKKNPYFLTYFEHFRNKGKFSKNDLTLFKKPAKKEYKPQAILWKFILECLNNPELNNCICWTNESEREFCIKSPDEFSKLWANEKGNKSYLSFKSILRSLGLYCQQERLEKVKETKNTFKFKNLI